jgi:hypothetical protein
MAGLDDLTRPLSEVRSITACDGVVGGHADQVVFMSVRKGQRASRRSSPLQWTLKKARKRAPGWASPV